MIESISKNSEAYQAQKDCTLPKEKLGFDWKAAQTYPDCQAWIAPTDEAPYKPAKEGGGVSTLSFVSVLYKVPKVACIKNS